MFIQIIRQIFQKLLTLLAVLLLVSVLVFIITRLSHGDPIALYLGDSASMDDVAKLRETYGLNQPVLIQYFYWLGRVAVGDFGNSIFLEAPVLQIILSRLEITFLLAIFAISIASLIGIPLGVISALFQGKKSDILIRFFAMGGSCVPSFWLGLLFIQFFAVYLGIFPVSGYSEPDANFLQRTYHLILPASVLGILNSALIIRFTRAAMLDILNEDFMRTATAKGLPQSTIIFKHGLRNCLIPIITVVGLTFALLIGGAVVTESLFNLPGIGNLVVKAVLRRDYPVIQGALLAIAFIYVVINFLIDLIYIVIDPRIRLGNS